MPPMHGGAGMSPGYKQSYQIVLARLRRLWLDYSTDESGAFGSPVQSDFYDGWFLPMAQGMTGMWLGRAGMPIARQHNSTLSLRSNTPNATVRFTLDGSAVTATSPMFTSLVNNPNAPMRRLRAVAFHATLSRVASSSTMDGGNSHAQTRLELSRQARRMTIRR